MSQVINISITESSDFIVAGIPRYVKVQTNLPSTIFYTLDGSEPNTSSSIYIDRIMIPASLLIITLKLFATNGVDTSPIITEVYQTDIITHSRNLPAGTTQQPGPAVNTVKFPFGSDSYDQNIQFNDNFGYVTLDTSKPVHVYAYNGDGYQVPQSNLPIPISNQIYSTTNAIGETGPGIGTIPYKITVETPPPPPQESYSFSKLFDPRAQVIFHDVSKENPEDPPMINNQFYSTLDKEKYKYGSMLHVSAEDAPASTGTFIKQFYNPRDNTLTYYYFESITNKWIISKTPFEPRSTQDMSLYNVVHGRGNGSQYVFKWIRFKQKMLG